MHRWLGEEADSYPLSAERRQGESDLENQMLLAPVARQPLLRHCVNLTCSAGVDVGCGTAEKVAS